MDSFRRSLRALSHPLSLAAIGLLLLNDHVLKAAYPSWLTGKLSDFAGLFFFPFLLISLLALPLAALRRPRAEAWLPKLAFALIAVWWAAIKLWPPANAATAAFVGRLVGGPIFIAPDSTDVVALVVLGPAWWLWQRITPDPAQPTVPTRPLDWKGLAALAVATAASMATSCLPPQKLIRVAALDGALYAAMNRGYADDPAVGELVPNRIGTGLNLWREDEVPGVVREELREALTYPRVACDPDNPQWCYRVTGSEQVEGSTDGGQSWQIAWQIPPERRSFVEHYVQQLALCSFPGSADFRAVDVIFAKRPEGTQVVVAMSSQGLLMRTATGDWQRISVDSTGPVPFSSGSLWIIWREILASLAAGFVVLLGLTTLTWGLVLKHTGSDWGRVSLPISLVIAGVVIPFVVTVGSLMTDLPLINLGFLIGTLLGPALFLIGLGLGWNAMTRSVVQTDDVGHMARLCGLAAGLTVILPVLILYLWLTGLIPWYEIGLIAAVGAALAIATWCARAIVSTARFLS